MIHTVMPSLLRGRHVFQNRERHNSNGIGESCGGAFIIPVRWKSGTARKMKNDEIPLFFTRRTVNIRA